MSELNKRCEVCNELIPDDYGNALCMKCYERQAQEADELRKQQPPTEQEVRNTSSVETVDPLLGVEDPNYASNPQQEDKEQWLANISQFQHSKKLLWYHTRDMYTWIKDSFITKVREHPQYPKFIWKPKVVDVGCGSGIGANVLSLEADLVWGIDKNATSVAFAQEAFTRVKNGIYYSSQLTFDRVDIMEDTREFMRFDVVVAIEIIEHIADHRGFIETLIKKFDKQFDKNYNPAEPTEYYISTPNRNSPTIQNDHPKNPFHVKEFTAQEFVGELSRYFETVELFNVKGKPEPNDTTQTPILARCSGAHL